MDDRVFAERAALGRPEEINGAVERLFAALPACGQLSAASRVLIKPNLLARHAPDKAVTTHPDVLRAVVLALQKRGVQSITVADSPGGPYTPGAMRGVYKGCGLAEVCEETGAALYTDCEVVTRAGQGSYVKSFELLRPVEDCNFIINLPKFKTHVLTTVSGAVKNLFGTVPGLQKAEFHMRFPQREHFAGMLVDLCEEVQADVHIVDGLLAMEGDGPGSGTPRRCDLLLAGENPYNVDLAVCRYMGIEAMATPVLAEAHGRELCGTALDDTLLVGADAAKTPFERYQPPRSFSGRMNMTESIPAFLRPVMDWATPKVAPRPVVHKKACIGCGKCAEICPQQVISLKNGKAKIDYSGCIRCFCCHEICPVHTIGVRRLPLFKM